MNKRRARIIFPIPTSIDKFELDSFEGLEMIPMEIRARGGAKILSFAQDLLASPQALPLYRSQVLFLGPEKSGKTLLQESLFPIVGWFEIKDKPLQIFSFRHFLILQGKNLSRYTSENCQKFVNRYVLNHEEWRIQDLNDDLQPGFLLIQTGKKRRRLELHVENKKMKGVWFTRLSRCLEKESDADLDPQAFRISSPALFQKIPEKSRLELTVWDFPGSRSHFERLLHLISPRSLCVAVWNLADEQSLNELEKWISTFLACHPPECHSEPWVIVVGTHLGTLPLLARLESEKRGREQIVKSILAKYGVESFQYVEVDSLGLEGISFLKVKLIELALAQPHMGEKVPRSYLLVEDYLQRLRFSEGNQFPVAKVEDFPSRLGKPEAILRALSLFSQWKTCLLHPNPPYNVVYDPLSFFKNYIYKVISLNQTMYPDEKGAIVPFNNTPMFFPEKEKSMVKEFFSSTLSFTNNLGLSFSSNGFHLAGKATSHSGPTTIFPLFLSKRPPGVLELWWKNERMEIQEETSNLYFNVLPEVLVSALLTSVQGLLFRSTLWSRGALLEVDKARVLLTVNPILRHVQVVARSRERSDCASAIQSVISQLIPCLTLFPGVYLRAEPLENMVFLLHFLNQYRKT